MSVKVDTLSKSYGTNRAVDQISFEVGKGEIVGFLGPNGAGKSTTMKIVTGCLAADSGKVFINGTDTEGCMESLKKEIGYLPENNPLYLNMYVKEYLEYSARIYMPQSQVQSAVKNAIDAVGLGEHQYKKCGELSKGYRQRTGLARAMVHNPSILILDEPTTGLDPNQILEIRDLIKLLGSEKTVILSTHIMQEAEAVCSRAVIINKGKIVADDTLQNLRAAGNTSNIIVEFNHNPDISMLKTAFGTDNVTENQGLWQIKQPDGADIREAVFDFAVANNLKILTLSQNKNSLEKIFRDLTQQV
ncbi:MAG: gliding motility-associated ABC transporter ATP-binding subunit GldA [Bacteroidales bacterium]|nr:gliding motility-associated ABC transporter ATP-binding subunit GldA [Bacteroidales bacterium]